MISRIFFAQKYKCTKFERIQLSQTFHYFYLASGAFRRFSFWLKTFGGTDFPSQSFQDHLEGANTLHSKNLF